MSFKNLITGNDIKHHFTKPEDFVYYQTKSTSERVRSFESVISKFPNRIPCLVESNELKLKQHKYIVPNDCTIGQLLHSIRTKEELKPEEALFIFINGELPTNSDLISKWYAKAKNEDDNFLYVYIAKENCFGFSF